MPRGDKGSRPGRPTFVGPDYMRAAYSDAELRDMKQTRSTAVHKVMMEHGSRKELLDVKDQTVYDAEWSIDEEDSVVWAKVPNREGHWVHLVRTRKSQVQVLETRSKGGETQSMWCGGGFSIWKPNGAILRCQILRGKAEVVHRPKTKATDPEMANNKTRDLKMEEVEKLMGQKPQKEREAIEKAVDKLSEDRRVTKAHAEATFLASRSSRYNGARLSATNRGKKVDIENLDPFTLERLFKIWNRETSLEGEATTSAADRMPRHLIIQAFERLAYKQWASTESIVAASTDPPVGFADAIYPECAQRISSERKETEGWFEVLKGRGIEIREKHVTVVRDDGSKSRQKHYRWDP